jgi:hypothetical protein
MTIATLATVAATVGGDIVALRSASVTAENKASPFARSMLAALMSGVWSRDLAVSAIITAFGNPKSPKSGKPISKLSGLRDFTGGDAVRKTAETVFSVFENIDAVPGVRTLVTDFVLSTNGAAKSLRALLVAVKEATKAHAATLIDADAVTEAEGDNDAAEGDAPSTDAPVADMTLSERVQALIVAFQSATPEAKSEAQPALELLWDTIRADVVISADEAFANAA